MVALGVLVILAIVLVVVIVRGYRKLMVKFDSVRALPELQLNTGTVLSALVGILTRNYVQAAGGLLKGLKVEGNIICTNSGLLPLYLPKTEHRISVEDRVCSGEVRLPAFWLKPRTARTFPASVALDKGCLPQVAVAGLSGKRTIRVEVRTRAKIGLFSFSRVTRLSPSLWHGAGMLQEVASKTKPS